MTTYYVGGYDTRKLNVIITATVKKLDENDNHLILKNGDDIEVYVDDNSWTVVDAPEYGGREMQFNCRYDAIIAIMRMSRRGL